MMLKGGTIIIIWSFINDIHRTKREDISAAMARTINSIEEMVVLAEAKGVEPILAAEVTIRDKDDLGRTVSCWVGSVLSETGYHC